MIILISFSLACFLLSACTTPSPESIQIVIEEKGDIVLPTIPDYYYTKDYLNNKITLINEKIGECSNQGDVFFWITDIHWEADRNTRLAPSLIDHIRQNTNIPRLFNGGDNQDGIDGLGRWKVSTYNGNVDLTNKLRKAMDSNKVYTIYGNHEVIHYNTYSELFNAIRLHNDDVVYGDLDKSYFYVDNFQQKIRYIALTAFGVPEEGKNYYNLAYRNEFEYNPEQLDWLMGTALDLNSEWTAVIFIHSIFLVSVADNYRISPKRNATGFNSWKVAYGEPWPYVNIWLDAITNYSIDRKGEVVDYDPRPLDNQGNIDESLAEVVIVEEGIPAQAYKFMLYSPNNDSSYIKYIARVKWNSPTQSWRLVWTEYGKYEAKTTLNIGDEVTVWKGFNGKIAGVFQGHTHKDRMHIENGIPFIISACDRYLDVGDLTVTRTPGTITEQHFEVAILNKISQKWTLISIGAPANDGFDDSIGDEVQIREIYYQ